MRLMPSLAAWHEATERQAHAREAEQKGRGATPSGWAPVKALCFVFMRLLSLPGVVGRRFQVWLSSGCASAPGFPVVRP